MKMQFTCPRCGAHFFIRTIEQRAEYLGSDILREGEDWVIPPSRPWAEDAQRLVRVRCADCGCEWADFDALLQAKAIAPHPLNGKRCINCTAYALSGESVPVNLVVEDGYELTPEDMENIRIRALGKDVPGVVICPELTRSAEPVDILLQ